MPRVARFNIEAIRDLIHQLEYAPPETRRRQMLATEKLLADINPKQNYPHEFIVYRITGYRPESTDEEIMFVGEALVPDLVSFIQTLSGDLEIPPDFNGRTCITLEEAAKRLNVSEKTIQRYRKKGLVCHYVTHADGSKRLACFEDALTQFIESHQRDVSRASSFTRIDGQAATQIIAEAKRLHLEEKMTLNEVARVLAKQFNRAHETVRLLLRRHDRKESDPIFSERGQLTERDGRVIDRASHRAIDPAQIARHFNKSAPAIYRVINHHRALFLKSLDLKPGSQLNPDNAILSSASATTNLYSSVSADDLMELITALRSQSETSPKDVNDLIAAMLFLKNRSAAAIASLDEFPRSQSLDEIETDLRWAGLLQRKLVIITLAPAMERVEKVIHRALFDLPTELLTMLFQRAVTIVAETLDSIDPSRNHHLAKLSCLAIERDLAQLELKRLESRAAAIHHPGSMAIADPFADLNPWNRRLNPPAVYLTRLRVLDDDSRNVINLHFGYTGRPPMTIATLSKELNITSVHAVRLLRTALRTLRPAART